VGVLYHIACIGFFHTEHWYHIGKAMHQNLVALVLFKCAWLKQGNLSHCFTVVQIGQIGTQMDTQSNITCMGNVDLTLQASNCKVE
jgi:hypothetical protein